MGRLAHVPRICMFGVNPFVHALMLMSPDYLYSEYRGGRRRYGRARCQSESSHLIHIDIANGAGKHVQAAGLQKLSNFLKVSSSVHGDMESQTR